MSQQERGSTSGQEGDLAYSLAGLNLDDRRPSSVPSDGSGIQITTAEATDTKPDSADPGGPTNLTASGSSQFSFSETADSAPPLRFAKERPMSAAELVQMDVELAAQKRKAEEVRKQYPDTQYLNDADAITYKHQVEERESRRAQEVYIALLKENEDKQVAAAREEELNKRAEKEVDLTCCASDEELNLSDFE